MAFSGRGAEKAEFGMKMVLSFFFVLVILARRFSFRFSRRDLWPYSLLFLVFYLVVSYHLSPSPYLTRAALWTMCGPLLVYLMLRVAIARLMSRTEEKLPLLLDDPLVQCDRVRQEQTLEFLAHLAKEMQVFLFTKDEWTKEWFERKLGVHSYHSLHLLS